MTPPFRPRLLRPSRVTSRWRIVAVVVALHSPQAGAAAASEPAAAAPPAPAAAGSTAVPNNEAERLKRVADEVRRLRAAREAPVSPAPAASPPVGASLAAPGAAEAEVPAVPSGIPPVSASLQEFVASDPEAARREAVAQAVRMRRAMREKGISGPDVITVKGLPVPTPSAETRGGIFQPKALAPSPADDTAMIQLEQDSIASVATIYATFAQKEVLVSGRVWDRRVTVPSTRGGRSELVAALDQALATAGVRVVVISPHTVAFAE